MCPFSFQSPHVSGLKNTRSVGVGPGGGCDGRCLRWHRGGCGRNRHLRGGCGRGRDTTCQTGEQQADYVLWRGPKIRFHVSFLLLNITLKYILQLLGALPRSLHRTIECNKNYLELESDSWIFRFRSEPTPFQFDRRSWRSVKAIDFRHHL